ncbi:MAG: DUF4037 domain-containing protein [Clostridia bacterium]|nr:DUF4037 domain-containing protein [Clostridia bacterium]
MKGIELSRAFYEQCGKPVLEEQFSDVLPYLAVGLIGSGSECFGFDDDVSADHDFEPGFCIFLPGEDVIDRKRAFALERAYAKLPKEFMGYRRAMLAPVGGARHGVIRLGEWLAEKLGSKSGALTAEEYLRLPEQALAELTNGEVFFDNYGQLSEIRESLRQFPAEIRRKKLAGNLLLMAQAGQYNYMRCLKHGEQAAAQLAVFEFVRAAMHVIFLLNNRYEPYYKWSFKALRALPLLSIEAELFEYLLTTPNEGDTAEQKYDVIEGICTDVIDELAAQSLTKAICGDLEKHAYSVNDSIEDAEIRNMSIFAGV